MNPFSRRFSRMPGVLLLGIYFVAAFSPRSHGDELTRQVQEELRKRNLYFGDVNGLQTPQVSAALSRYQEHKGFHATGMPDDLTLRSLGVEDAGPPVSNANSPAPMNTAGDGATAGTPALSATWTPWPDLPVIRRDLGRENAASATDLEQPDLLSTPTPAFKPPPDAVSAVSPAMAGIQHFVADFVRLGESSHPDAQQPFFADHVNYFDDGKVSRAFIVKDTERYNKRWPIRHFEVMDALRVAAVPDQSPPRFVVNFRCRFEVKQGGREVKDPKAVQGEVDETYTLEQTGADGFQLVGIQEQRVRGK